MDSFSTNATTFRVELIKTIFLILFVFSIGWWFCVLIVYTATFSPASNSPSSSCLTPRTFPVLCRTPKLNRSLSLSFLFIYYFGAQNKNRPLYRFFEQILLKQLIREIRPGRLRSRGRWHCCPRWHAGRRVSLAPRPNQKGQEIHT